MKYDRSKKKKIIFVLFIVFISCQSAICADSHQGYPEVGKPCPFFKLSGIEYYSQTDISLSDLRGRYVLLDFFSSGCATCFGSFSKMSHLRSEFKSKLEMFVVGYTDKHIRKTYEAFRKKQHLNLPVCYDSSLFKRFVPAYVPHIVWINPDGIVVAITSSPDVTESNIAKFIAGKPFEFTDISEKSLQVLEQRQDSITKARNLISVYGNLSGDSTLLFQSFLKRWTKGDPMNCPSSIKESLQYISPRKFEINSVNLSFLYRYAYTGNAVWYPGDSLYGKFALNPIVETSDKRLFEAHYPTSKDIFTYSVTVPENKATPQYIQQIMQHDLKNYFGYDVKVEKRKMPCWFLTATDDARKKLETKGGDSTKSTFSYAKFSLINMPVNELLRILAIRFDFGRIPFIDRTGITSNIDIKVDAISTDFNATKKELERKGLDIVAGEIEMDVIVVRDPSHQVD